MIAATISIICGMTAKKNEFNIKQKYKLSDKDTKILEMKNLIKVLSIMTFLSVNVTVAGIFYEGAVLKWFTIVGILMRVTDILFIIATVAGVFYYKSIKALFYTHLISIFIILAGVIIMMIFGEEIPKFLLVFWFFYILYFYGVIVCKKLWQNLS